MDQTKNTTAERIKQRLTICNMSRKELAEKLGVKPSTISHYISGTRRVRGTRLSALADALDTTTDYLLGAESEQNFDSEYYHAKRWIESNADKLTTEQKANIIKELFCG